MNNIKKEGFWYSTREPNLPMPVSNVLSEDEAKKIYALILKKQKECREVAYKGLAHSRLSRCMLGCKEYITLDSAWKWPGDFAEHYVLKHKVRPTDEFLKFIGYEE